MLKMLGKKIFTVLLIYLSTSIENMVRKQDFCHTCFFHSYDTDLDYPKNMRKIVDIFLPIIVSICIGCSKEPYH